MAASDAISMMAVDSSHHSRRSAWRRLPAARRLGCTILTCAGLLATCPGLHAAETADWWNPRWRLRTTIRRAVPYRDDKPRAAEVAIDFPLLLERAGVAGRFDPNSLRLVRRSTQNGPRAVPFAYRTENGSTNGRQSHVLNWVVHPKAGQVAAYDVYFDTTDRGLEPLEVDPQAVPPNNLLANPGFEQLTDELPAGWTCSPSELVRTGRFAHGSGDRSLQIAVDGDTPESVRREVTLSQTVDVKRFAGQEILFECDLLAERAVYGAPVCIELQQFREDGNRILEFAVEPRWLTLELAEGQFVRLSQRGALSHEATTVSVRIRVRCSVRDADTARPVSGPESWVTVWLDRVVLRPGERWPWPGATAAGFVTGALENAPINRGFEFTGLRRVAFNGASEGTLTAGRHNPHHRSVHWGLQAGTLEFWCRPKWDIDDGHEHIFFQGVAYGHRLQSQLRKLDAAGGNRLEFTIADSSGTRRTVRGQARLQARRWHHVAATWDFPRACLGLFVDGRPVAGEGPGDEPWPSSRVPENGTEYRGMGISEKDQRSLPMQAFIGGDRRCSPDRAADAVLDEMRISSVARYADAFVPRRAEFPMDQHTRALFHFENTWHGMHDADDRFVRGHPACELPPRKEAVPLELLGDGAIERRLVVVRPYATESLFQRNRAENRLTVTRPFGTPPDPASVEYRPRQLERVVTGIDDELVIGVGGDFEPLMKSVTFEHADGSAASVTLLPRWRANDNVVPFSWDTIAATLAPDVQDDAARALEVFRYALATTNYFDAHYCETLPARHRPRVSYTLIKALNIYPFDQCGPLNYTLRKLFLAAGISSNDASGTHHQFQQAYYDGDYRLFDLSPRIYWLQRDNATVASRRDFEEDLYLKLRQGSGVTSGLRGRVSRARFGVAERPHGMDFALRPGERASICWHNEGRWFELTEDRQSIPLARIPPCFGNGAVVFEPTSNGEAVALDNLAIDQSDGEPVGLRPIDAARPASLTYRARCPYIFSDAVVEGNYRTDEARPISLSFSCDEGNTWTEVWRSDEPAGSIALSLRDHVSARYAYWLKLDFAGGAWATVMGLKVRSTFVVSPLSLPGKLALGENRIQFAGGPVTSRIRTVCRWVERYRSEWAVRLNSIRYSMNGDEAERNLYVVAPGDRLPVRVTLAGRRPRTKVSLQGLPAGWSVSPQVQSLGAGDSGRPASVEFLVQPGPTVEGDIHCFDVVVRGEMRERRLPAQILVAAAPLVSEAEQATELAGHAKPFEQAELSNAGGVEVHREGKLGFPVNVPRAGRYALWLRARWDTGADITMWLSTDGEKRRKFTPSARIGFTDWHDPGHAHTKMFAHFGEQYGHWSWYRLPDVQLRAGLQQLILGAGGGCFDALLLLPQNAVMDRAAMNLLQNWNFAPWDNPL